MNQPTDTTEAPHRVVIAAVDVSPDWELVLERAAREAQVLKADLHALFALAVPIAVDDAQAMAGAGMQIALREQSEVGRSHMAAVMARAASLGVPARGHVKVGEPWREIVQLATDLSADLVVVGTQDLQGVARLLLGSVAAQVARNAPCEVLVVRAKKSIHDAVPEILAPCEDCLAAQRASRGKALWCDRHLEHHPHAHTYSTPNEGYGMGSLTYRSE